MSSSPPTARRRRGKARRNGRAAATLLALVVLAAIPATASAHPFGPPLVANVAVQGDAVIVGWSAAEDDWVALGRGLGVLDGPTEQVDPDASVPATGFERIAGSEAVAFYLLDHIQVHQDGVACDGEVSFPPDLGTLLATGVTVQFRCPDHVEGFDLTITALTDVHEAYRTVSTLTAAPDVRAIHTLAEPTHAVDPGAGRGSGIERTHLAALTAVAALAFLVVGLTLGRGPRRGVAPHDPDGPRSEPGSGSPPPGGRDHAADLAGSGVGREVS